MPRQNATSGQWGAWHTPCSGPGMEPLLVYHHLVLHGDGHERIQRFVRCPMQPGTVDVRACRSCPQSRGLLWDERLERDVVDCSVVPANETSVVPAIARRSASHGDALGSATIAEAFSPDVLCVAPECTVTATRRMMRDEAVSAVVVVGDDGSTVLGVISTTLLASMAPGDPGLVRDVMTRPLLVPRSMLITRAAAVMAYEGAHHLVVVERGDRLVGILSAIDVLRYLGEAGGSLVPRRTARQRRP